MPTPKQGYFRDDQKLPGVTTVLKQKDSSGLISAANSVGLKGKKVYGPDGEWSKAADIGTAAHAMIQSYIEKNACEMMDAALPAFESFLKWAEGRTFTGKCEVGLVHPILPFGGTIDYLDTENQLIFDWKTNSSLDYQEELYGQMGAYTLLAEGHGHYIRTATIVRFPKEGGPAEELVIETGSKQAVAGRQLFESLLAAYWAREEIKKKPIKLSMMAEVGGFKK